MRSSPLYNMARAASFRHNVLDGGSPSLAPFPTLAQAIRASPDARHIAGSLGEWLALSLIALAAPLCLATDLLALGRTVAEDSLTEFLQSGLLLATALSFARAAGYRPESRGFLVLAAGFFGCLFIREMDGFLDLVHHGFWIWPATFVALAAATVAARFGHDTLLSPMAHFLQTGPGHLIGIGLILVLVFSRVFGSGTLWQPLLGEPATALKNSLQEGLELFGYAWIAWGTHRYLQTPAPCQMLKM